MARAEDTTHDGPGAAADDDVSRIVSFFRFFWWEWAHRLSRSGLVEKASGLPLPHSAQLILVRLRATDSSSVSELAAMLHLDPSTVSRQVQPLKALGLVRRAASGDRRLSRLELTPAGDDAARAMEAVWRREWERALAPLGDDERSSLAALLERVRGGMVAEEAQEQAPVPPARSAERGRG